MKILIILMTTCLMQVSAFTYAQRISLSEKNASLISIFQKINKQSGVSFLVSNELLAGSKTVNIKVKDEALDEVLESIFEGQPLSYELKDKVVIVSRKDPSFLENVIARFQAIDVRGKVVDSLGNGLAGATVSVKGGKGSTSTAANGDFYLKNVDEVAVLVVSYLGYVTKEVIVSKEFNYIALRQSESKLDEVQIQAYGLTSRRLSTGNIAKVTAEEIARQPVNNPLLALAGRVPGLEISQSTGLPGAGINIRIQGTNSINAFANEPFYVVDGVPYPSSLLSNLGVVVGSGSAGGTSSGPGNPLSYINPQDIESIEVLKDASATAIYGSRAANGAILITTKKGKSGQSKVDVNIRSGIGQVSRKVDLLNTQQFLEMRREAFANNGVDFVNTFPYNFPDYKEYYAKEILIYDQNRSTDWQKELIGNKTGYHDAQLSISGGTPTMQYLASGTYHKEGTVFPGDNNDQKGTIHFNLNTVSSNQKLRMSLGGSYLMDNNKLANVDLTEAAMTLPPNAPTLYNLDGSLNWQPYTIERLDFTFSSFTNPLAAFTRLYRNKTDNLIGNANLSYELIPGLIIKSSFGYNKLQTDEIVTNPSTTSEPEFLSTFIRTASYGTNQINSWIAEPQLTYSKNIQKHKLNVLAGSSFQQTKNNRQQLNGTGYSSDLTIENINAAQTVSVQGGSTIISEYKYNALFGRISYSYDDKYILEGVGRRDGTSRFGSRNQFHNFGALSGAWIFSSAKFIHDNIKFLSFGKLRASYGSTGSDQIGDYKYLSLYKNNNPQIPYDGYSGLDPEGLSNPYIAWEETRKLSFGLDLGFFQDRILINATYFRNRTSNQLQFYLLPPSTGFTGIDSNFPATVQNRGAELSMSSLNIQTGNFNWKTNFNITIPDNKLLSFADLEQSSQSATLEIGKPITVQRLYKFGGVDPNTGIYQYYDKNGKLVARPETSPNNDFIKMNTSQSLYGGIQNSFGYKNLSFDFLFQFVKQNGFNYTYGTLRPGYDTRNQPVTILDRWQKSGDEKSVGKYSTANGVRALLRNSDAYWGDASYIRLKNVSLSWQLPNNWTDRAHLQNAKIYMQGQNLLTITNYLGLDPETRNSLGLPPLRVITFGIQLTL